MIITQRIYDGADSYPWMEYFAIIPRRTISGKLIFWEKAYKRRFWAVWGTGFHMEPEVEYGTLFDVLLNPCVNEMQE
jgi:hypothetical protein